MATLQDLLSNFGLGEDDGIDKEASEEKTDEQRLLETLLEDGETKTASQGGPEMGSLADLYMQLAEQDNDVSETEDTMDKVASQAAEEEVSIEKIAAEYDAAGRIMARGFFDEFQKLARDLEDPSKASTPAHGERGTAWQMETNYAEKGPMSAKDGKSEHAQILKGPASGKAGQAQAAMGGQFGTVKNLLTGRAKQTGAK